MRAEGYTIQEIADAVGCGLATVDRALKRLVARQLMLAGEVDKALARYADDGLRAEEVTSPEDIERLSDLEFWRLGFLPPSHPARQADSTAALYGYQRQIPGINC